MSERAALKEGRISQAESTDERRPTLGPIRRAARSEAAENKQEILSQEGQKIATYQVTANWFRGIGALLFIVGMGGLVYLYRK